MSIIYSIYFLKNNKKKKKQNKTKQYKTKQNKTKQTNDYNKPKKFYMFPFFTNTIHTILLF